MRALTWHGKRDVRVEDVPDPRIEQPTDAVVRALEGRLLTWRKTYRGA